MCDRQSAAWVVPPPASIAAAAIGRHQRFIASPFLLRHPVVTLLKPVCCSAVKNKFDLQQDSYDGTIIISKLDLVSGRKSRSNVLLSLPKKPSTILERFYLICTRNNLK